MQGSRWAQVGGAAGGEEAGQEGYGGEEEGDGKESQGIVGADAVELVLTPDRKLMEVPLEIRGGKLLPGAPRLLFQTHVTAPRFNDLQYDVTRDGSRFLVNSLKREAPLTLVPGWPALLRR